MAKRILVIDSDETFAQTLAAAITTSGLVPLVATNSDQGMALAKQESPDLMVVCVEAQPTNGYMLCTRLKKDDQLKSIPVILTSANATPESFEKHKKLKTRAEEYLIKPFDPRALLEKASGLLGVAIPAAGAVQTPEASAEDESLGLGSLASDDDEPIRLTDDDVRSPPVSGDADLDEVEEVVQLDEAVPEGDEDLEMFDQAFESLKPAEPAPVERPHLRLAPEPEGAAEPPAEKPSTPTEVSAPTDEQMLAGFSADLPAAVVAEDDAPEEEVLESKPAEEPGTAAEPESAAAPEVASEPDIASELDVASQPEVAAETKTDGEEVGEMGGEESLSGLLNADLEARVAELESELAEKTAELESAKQSSPSAELQRLKEGRNRQDKEILRLKQELHERETQFLDIQEQHTALEAQIQTLRDEARKRDSSAKSLQQRSDALAAAAKKLERELTGAREELKSNAAIKAKAAEADKMRVKLAEATSRCESLGTEIASVRELHESEVAELKAELEKARGELDGARSEALEATASADQNEERAVKAYQKIKNDEKLREKTRKALEIALSLLQENAIEPAEDREPEKRSA